MPEDETYKRKLLTLYLNNQCNPKELEEVMLMLQSSLADRILLAQMQEDFRFPSFKTETISVEQASRIREDLKKKVSSPAPVVSITWRKWQLPAAAASIAILIATGFYYFVWHPLQDKKIAKTEVNKRLSDHKIVPGTNKAVLTLADGSTIVLDDAQNGTLAQQGNTKVIKLNGKLNYEASSKASKEILYNTIATPRGGQYQVELPDETLVWLNALSSVRFPTVFAGNERHVEITGEVYFEVAKNKELPFIVKVNNAEVQVIGTHFNVMAYTEEEAVKTTLLEGSVKFVIGNNINLLKPGQQSQLLKNGQVKVISDVNVENVILWKNGMFHFENTDLETVMRQLSRWYDIEVVFKGKKLHDPLHVEIPVNTNLSNALKILEEAGTAKFEIEGNRITVIQ